MNRTIESCFKSYPLFNAILTSIAAKRWPFQKNSIMSNGSESGKISSGFFTKTDEDGRCIGGGIEITLETNPDPNDPESDKLRTIFHFTRDDLQMTRVEVVVDLSSECWSLLHLPSTRIETKEDPVWQLVNEAGVATPGGECEIPNIHSALATIEHLSDLAFAQANI